MPAPVIPAGNVRTVGWAEYVAAVARRTARKTNIIQPVVLFGTPAPVTTFKLVFIRPSLVRRLSFSVLISSNLPKTSPTIFNFGDIFYKLRSPMVAQVRHADWLRIKVVNALGGNKF